MLQCIFDKVQKMAGEGIMELKSGHPWLCMDNPSIHKQCEDVLKHYSVLQMSQPVGSPDFNKPAEHAHAIIVNHLLKELYLKPHIDTPVKYRRLAARMADVYITPDAVRRDVESLPEMWKYIAAPEDRGGSGGGWPPKALR